MIRNVILLVLVAGFAYLYGSNENVRETTNKVVKKVYEVVKTALIKLVDFIKSKV